MPFSCLYLHCFPLCIHKTHLPLEGSNSCECTNAVQNRRRKNWQCSARDRLFCCTYNSISMWHIHVKRERAGSLLDGMPCELFCTNQRGSFRKLCQVFRACPVPHFPVHNYLSLPGEGEFCERERESGAGRQVRKTTGFWKLPFDCEKRFCGRWSLQNLRLPARIRHHHHPAYQ